MTVDPQDIAKRLRENRENTKKESTAPVSYTHLRAHDT